MLVYISSMELRLNLIINSSIRAESRICSGLNKRHPEFISEPALILYRGSSTN
ncbi:hypothetical protein SAMN05660903_02408 [Salegentibacter salinarum]|nr:hypothetical protein SAMN05660903_02408 [Salegentibacter salinarum]